MGTTTKIQYPARGIGMFRSAGIAKLRPRAPPRNNSYRQLIDCFLWASLACLVKVSTTYLIHRTGRIMDPNSPQGMDCYDENSGKKCATPLPPERGGDVFVQAESMLSWSSKFPSYLNYRKHYYLVTTSRL